MSMTVKNQSENGSRVFRGIRRADVELRVGVGILFAILALGIMVPLLSPFGVSQFGVPLQAPSWGHPFGTDDLGRDMFVRTFAAAILDISVAVVLVAFANIVGSIIGVLAAMSPKLAESIVMRLVDSALAFPMTVLVLLVVAIVGPGTQIAGLPRGLPGIVIALLLIGWAFYARLARTQALAESSKDYITAAKTLGFSRTRIVVRHLLPQTMRTTAAYSIGDLVMVMGAIAGFAFLGAGVQPPTPEWGAMMFSGRGYLTTAPWMTVFPGMLLALTGVSLSLIADSILRGARRS